MGKPSLNLKTEKQMLLLDTDAGIDDAWAILMILASAQKHEQYIEISGITCVHGNTEVEQTCINVLRTLESCTRLDIPVFKGASSPLIKDANQHHKKFFGSDGFGCALHETTPDVKLVQEENAIVALNRIVTENKRQVSLVCFGPLTNIALAIRTYPTFEENLKEILIMGGNYTATGNTTNCSEFNFYSDPEAAHIVLNSAIKYKILVPWETCKGLEFSLEWRDSKLGGCDNASIQLMNHVEHPMRAKPSFKSWAPADQVLSAVLLDSAATIESVAMQLTVELAGFHTRGQVVVGHKKRQEQVSNNVNVITKVDQEVLAKLLLTIHRL